MMSTICWQTQLQPQSFRTVLFDFDGTISLIREGWQEIMQQYFVEVLTDTGGEDDEAAVASLVRKFIEQLTGEQTIYQCIRLRDEVLRRAGSAAEPMDYKAEFNRRLLNHIRRRLEALHSGEMSPEALLVPGIVPLLKTLRERGLNLYLASGTDEEYVREEAAALGVAEFFDDNIFGARVNYEEASKAAIIRRLILPQLQSGKELLGFGDGFVEIENVKEVGGTAVGVASDETGRRKLDPWKKRRLIDAGADLIIGDYSCREQWLPRLLGGQENGVQTL